MVLLSAAATGLRGFAIDQIESAGSDVIAVTATPEDPSGRSLTLPAALHEGDERLVLGACPHFNLASAENSVVVTGRAGGREQPHVEVRGLTPGGLRVLGLVPQSGRLFLDDEHTSGSRVAILGPEAARVFFGATSPLGRSVELGGWSFQIVGVLAWAGRPRDGLPSRLDDTVFVPFNAGAAAFHGTSHASTLRFRLAAANAGAAATAAADTVAILDRARTARGETGGALQVTNTVELMERYRWRLAILHGLVVLIGGAGLAVGMIGISNALSASLTNGPPPAGAPPATGLERHAAFFGVLRDGVMLAAPAGLVGALGAFTLARIAVLLPFLPVSARPQIPLSAGLLTAVLVVMLGAIAGVGPARKAVQLPKAPAVS
jgi:putative ABC transport system permease protein